MKKLKYTIEDLKLNQQLYKENFNKLIRCRPNSKNKQRYIKQEWKLNQKEINIRKSLNQEIVNPCPIDNSAIDCNTCTGYYITERKRKKIYRYQVEKEDNGILCQLKLVIKKGGKYENA